MFGTKQAKDQRHHRICELLQQHPHGLTLLELARLLKVPHTTILRDLPALEDKDIYLEECNGRLRIAFQDDED